MVYFLIDLAVTVLQDECLSRIPVGDDGSLGLANHHRVCHAQPKQEQQED